MDRMEHTPSVFLLVIYELEPEY